MTLVALLLACGWFLTAKRHGDVLAERDELARIRAAQGGVIADQQSLIASLMQANQEKTLAIEQIVRAIDQHEVRNWQSASERVH